MANEAKLKPIVAWDENNEIHFMYRQNGVRKEKIIRGFEWYFCITRAAFDSIGKREFRILNDYEMFEKIVGAGEYVKIYCKSVKDSQAIQTWLRDRGIALYEADLPLHKRYFIDNQIEIETDLKTLFFDIETDDTGKGIEIGRDRILSWAGYNSDGEQFFYAGDDEKMVLEKFLEELEKHDIYSGWNSEKFDRPYIMGRMTRHKLYYGNKVPKYEDEPTNWQRHIHVDLMQRCIKLYSYDMDKIGLTGFSLNEVSRVFLGESKVQHTEGILEMYQNNFEKFKEYNLKDAELLYKLDKKSDIIKLMIKECEVTGTMLNRFYVGELLDNYMLRKSKATGTYLPTRPNRDQVAVNKESDVIGGYVKEPLVGLYDHVRVFDFKSLYPSIIVSFNIGDDALDRNLSSQGDIAFDNYVHISKCCNAITTARIFRYDKHEIDDEGDELIIPAVKHFYTCSACNDNNVAVRKIEEIPFSEVHAFLMSEKKRLDPNNECIQTANNNFFRRNKNSFIAELVKELLALRQQYKKDLAKAAVGSGEYGNLKAMQAVIKELANSMFGVTGDKSSRYFNKNVAESITLTGQYLNKTIQHIVGELGHTAIYGDTDSIFVPIPMTVDGEEFVGQVNVKLKEFLQSEFGLAEYIIKLEYEKKYKRMLMLDKKKYTGIMDYLNEQAVDIRFSKGTEDIKRNTTELSRRKLIELIEMITREGRDVSQVKQWITELKEYVLTTTEVVPEDICITVKISKPIKEYKSKSAHVKLAERLIAEGKMLDVDGSTRYTWSRIKYIVDNMEDGQHAITPEEFTGIWDRRYYWDVQIYAPMYRMLQVAFPEIDWSEFLIELQAKKTQKIEKERIREEKKIAAEQLKADKKRLREEKLAAAKAKLEALKKSKTQTTLF